MAETHTHLKVFVASPGDVPDERQKLEEIISEFNLTWGGNQGVHLELVKWETHTRPAIGEDAMGVVSQQIGDDYDIFLGIMWGRFGSPTNRAESGTEEEFNRACSRLSSSPGSVQIMFYFKNAGIPPNKVDLGQLGKVLAFKSRIAADHGALYHEFETTEDFRTKVRIHLSKVVQDWLDANSTGAVSTTPKSAVPTTDTNDPLANLTALTDDDYDEGLIELSERATDAVAMVVSIVERMSEATEELGEKFQLRTDEVNRLMVGDATPDVKSAKRVSNNAASDIEMYVNRLSVEIPAFQEQHLLAMDTFGNIAMISHWDLADDLEDIKTTTKQIQRYCDAISKSSESLFEFRETIAGLSRMTTALNRARRRAVAIIDDLLAQLRTAKSQSEDVVQLLERMTHGGEDNAE